MYERIGQDGVLDNIFNNSDEAKSHILRRGILCYQIQNVTSLHDGSEDIRFSVQ